MSGAIPLRCGRVWGPARKAAQRRPFGWSASSFSPRKHTISSSSLGASTAHSTTARSDIGSGTAEPQDDPKTMFERYQSTQPFEPLGAGVWDPSPVSGLPDSQSDVATAGPAERQRATSPSSNSMGSLGPSPVPAHNPSSGTLNLAANGFSHGAAAPAGGPGDGSAQHPVRVVAPSAASLGLYTNSVETLASVAETDEHCTASHPGSVCCTTTSVEKDSTSDACTVTLKCTVKLTDSRLHVAPAELEELAWVAARDAASEAVLALNRRSAGGPTGREERHRFVCQTLRSGTIRDAKRNENGFGHVSYLVTLEDKKGRKIRAAFKPRVEGDCEGWHRVPIEVAAYQLNLLLGMDVVPPAVLREDIDADWTHYPAGGAFIYWCGAARQLDAVPMEEWSVPGPVLLSDTRILDVLLQNSDRHAGHFLYAEHWADGDYAPVPHAQPQHQPTKGGGSTHTGAWRGRMSPVLIDHAAGFRAGAFVCLDHENSFLTGPTRHISARTYMRLRFLDAPSLRAALRGIITDEEVAALLLRRDAVLSFFDGLVAEKGYDAVVLEV